MRSHRARANGDDYSTRLMTGNDRWNFSSRSTIPVQVASAHPGGLDFKNNFSDARGWVRKGCKFESRVTAKDDTAHVLISSSVFAVNCIRQARL
jgi:hypothetical protein